MRLLIEIVIVAGLIYIGWDRPFHEWAARGGAITNSKIHMPAWEDNSPVPGAPAAPQTYTGRARPSPKHP